MNFRITDFHAHVSGPQAADELLRISGSEHWRHVVVSGNLIDPAKLGDFLRGEAPPLTLLPNNDFLLKRCELSPGTLIPFFTIDPNHDLDSDIDEAVSAGFQGFKLNPIVHRTGFMEPGALELFSRIPEGCPIYLHLTLHPDSNLSSLITLAKAVPQVNWIIGHMGYASSDFAAIDAASRYGNIYLETSIGSRLALMEAKRRGLAGKLVFGSEFPSQDPRWELGKIKSIFNEAEIVRICSANASELLAWRVNVEA